TNNDLTNNANIIMKKSLFIQLYNCTMNACDINFPIALFTASPAENTQSPFPARLPHPSLKAE
ncbi:hypothetical protein, partial [Acinetobacter lactucae]|uniref:hypothetical protein n=1 Tax=Acinetobacter lactucae TaxID=1785128 RepID=UPI001C2E88AD